jgi:hypothetical protein
MEALEDIPKVEGPLLTEKGEATLQKTDIFRKIMWFGFAAENTWYPLNVARVNQILAMNREGKKPANLDLDVLAEKVPLETLNSDLTRMDQKFKGKSKKKKKKKGGGGSGGNAEAAIPGGASGPGTIDTTENQNQAISDEDIPFVDHHGSFLDRM